MPLTHIAPFGTFQACRGSGYKSTSDLAREWSERSRMEIAGYWPQFAFGNTVADRNTVVARDLSSLRKPQPAGR
jgi:hypothetical protein